MSTETHHFKHLNTPFKLGSVEVKNRFVFLPHWPNFSRDGYPTETMINYYTERAKGGAGLIIIESQAGHPEGQMCPDFIKAYDQSTIPLLQRLTTSVHSYGAKIFGQLTHQGHTTLMKPPQLLYAPTQMPEPYSRYNTKEMEKEDILSIVHYFTIAASNQKKAGFDGVELKVAHDGLLRSFVSPFFNQRDDEYGGDFDKRFKIIKDLIEAIRNVVGPDFTIGVRLCLDEFTEHGYSLDYGIKLAQSLEKIGVDYINTDSGTFSSFFMEIPPMPIPLGFAIYMSAEVKKAVKIPVIAFGRINDPVQAETIIAEGCADMVGMCRQLVCDPETPNKTFAGRLDDVRHCIACNDGCIFQVMQGKPLHCIQNPAAGREGQYGIGTLEPANSPQEILIIGGGVAGMKAAEIAARRGHAVTLLEKSDRLGGQIMFAEKLPYRVEIAEVPRYLKIQLENLNVKILLNQEADVEWVKKNNPDSIIIATGSKTHIPVINGAEESSIKIIDPRQALANPEMMGQRTVIIERDGHWQGAGVCEYAMNHCKEIFAVTPEFILGVDLEPSNSHMLHKRLFDGGVNILTAHDIDAVDGSDVILVNVFNHKQQRLKDIDTLIYAGPTRSENRLYRELKSTFSNVHAVGDCVAPRLIEQVIFESEMLARKL